MFKFFFCHFKNQNLTALIYTSSLVGGLTASAVWKNILACALRFPTFMHQTTQPYSFICFHTKMWSESFKHISYILSKRLKSNFISLSHKRKNASEFDHTISCKLCHLHFKPNILLQIMPNAITFIYFLRKILHLL